MKSLVVLSVFLLASLSVSAQLQKGGWMVGGTGGGAFGGGGGGGGSVVTVSLAPRAGYFLTDRVVVGSEIGLGYTTFRGDNPVRQHIFGTGLQPFARYYFGKAPGSDDASGLLVPFAELSGGFNYGRAGNSSAMMGSASAALGANYFLNRNVALEAGLYYSRYFNQDGRIFATQPLNLRIGFQIFLGGRNRSASPATELREP